MTIDTQRDILMTIALPYANGEIHLGHMLEAVQADIWARFQRLRGHRCLFLCGSDAHGTAIMLAAEKQGITPEALVETARQNHLRDFQGFLVEFDHFYTTHSPENQTLASDLYLRLREKGDINTRVISHAFDPEKKMFLADRFIRGTCPKCGATDQYGDNCEVCGASYDISQLINPVSAHSGATPIQKDSEHYFFNLSHYTQFLHNWIHTQKPVSTHVANKLEEWFGESLREWDISRDAPYFGFEIPDTHNKYFYVWLEAPVGYMASLKNLCQQRDDIDFDHYWQKGSTAELCHFIGKDIVYFHALFWPALLEGGGYRLPNHLFVHGYLTINGEKMSKSRGTFITAKAYLDKLNPEYLRYYFAAKLNSQIEDIDLNLADFAQRVNADLVGKYVNLASRCAGFIEKRFDLRLAGVHHDDSLWQTFLSAGESIAQHFESLNTNQAVRDIMALADKANQYIDHHKPWSLAKDPEQLEAVQQICTQGLNLFKVLTTYLKPILPNTAKKVEAFLNCEELTWDNRAEALFNHEIRLFEPLMQRITPEQVVFD